MLNLQSLQTIANIGGVGSVSTGSSLLNSLSAYWKLDSNSNDSSGNGHNGTDTSISYAAGKIGNGAGFSAVSSSKIAITDHARFKPTIAYSIFSWMRIGSGTGLHIIFNSFNTATGNSGISFGLNVASDAEHKLTIIQGNDTPAGYANLSGATTVDDNTLRHVGVIWNGTTLKIYVNGAEDATTNYSTAPVFQSTNYVRIGCNTQGGADSKFFNGIIDELGFWSRALTTDEIALLYNSGNGRTYPFS